MISPWPGWLLGDGTNSTRGGGGGEEDEERNKFNGVGRWWWWASATIYSLLRRGHYLIKSWFDDFLREKFASVSVPENLPPPTNNGTNRKVTNQSSFQINQPPTR